MAIANKENERTVNDMDGMVIVMLIFFAVVAFGLSAM